MKRCSALPVPASTVTPSQDLLSMYGSLQGQYSDCAVRHDCLIAAITGETICFQPGKENDKNSNSTKK